MTDAELQALGEAADPAVRARLASDFVARHQIAMTEISRIRREALEELVALGMSHAEIAAKIGTTRPRVYQLLSSGPRPERAMLGTGTITVAIGGKPEKGRRDTQQQAVVSAEASKAYEVLTKLASSLSLQTQMEIVPPPGFVDLNRPNLIVLTSPRLLPFLAQVLPADPIYGFDKSDQGLFLVDKETGTEYWPPQDTTGEPCDFGYVGRLPRPDGKGTFLYLAGVHAPGTWGAARYLEEHLDEFYRDFKLKRFSVLVKVEYDPETRAPKAVSELAPLRRHEGS